MCYVHYSQKGHFLDLTDGFKIYMGVTSPRALAQRLLGVGGLMSQVPADLTAVSSDGTVPVGALLGGIHNILTWRVSQHAGICAARSFVF